MTQSQCVQEPIKPVRILVVGDSLSTEFGLAPGTGWVEQLKLALDQELPTAVLKNASIAGNTTSHGVSRLPSLLLQETPTHVIIGLGGFDASRGLPLDLIEKNLTEMIALVQSTQAEVVLIGMQTLSNHDPTYSEQFKNVFSEIATSTHAALVTFEGFAEQRQYFQADGVHPNETAQPQILKNVRQALDRLLP